MNIDQAREDVEPDGWETLHTLVALPLWGLGRRHRHLARPFDWLLGVTASRSASMTERRRRADWRSGWAMASAGISLRAYFLDGIPKHPQPHEQAIIDGFRAWFNQ